MARGVKMEDWETEEGLAILKASASLTMERIAKEVVGLQDRTTLYRWCKKSPKINEALTQKLDEEHRLKVEEAQLKACFDHKVKVKSKRQALDRDGIVHNLVDEKEVVIPADTRAQQYYLNNRNPGRWSQKPVAEVDDTAVAGFIPVPDLMDEPDANAGEDTEVRAIE